MKEFAISFHFYCPLAYRFVQKALHLTPINIEIMVSECVIFLQKPLDFVEQKVNEGQKYCVVRVDKMAKKDH